MKLEEPAISNFYFFDELGKIWGLVIDLRGLRFVEGGMVFCLVGLGDFLSFYHGFELA